MEASHQADLAASLMTRPYTTAGTRRKPCCKNRKKEAWTDGALLTEYQKEYWEKRAPHERAQPKYPRNTIGPAGDFDPATTYTLDYPPKEGDRAASYKPAAGEKENLPFSPWTTYKVDFPAKDAPYHRVRPVQQLGPATGRFQDDTEMKTAFPGWAGAKPSTPAHGRGVSVPRGMGPFEGLSAYKDDYRRWPGARPPPAAPLLGGRSALPGGTFVDATTHRTAFTPKQGAPERVRPEQSALAKEGWYDGTPGTEYRSQYPEKEGGPQARAGATTGASGQALPKGPFAGATTYNTEYRPRTAPDIIRAGRPTDEPVSGGPFDGATTYKVDFPAKDAPYHRVRPVQQLGPATGPFQDATEMKSAYPGWNAGPAERVAAKPGNLQSGGPFDGATTYKTDYIRMKGDRANLPGRPQSGTRALRGTGPFAGTTEYTTSYTPKRSDPVHAYRPGTCSSCDPASDCEDPL